MGAGRIARKGRDQASTPGRASPTRLPVAAKNLWQDRQFPIGRHRDNRLHHGLAPDQGKFHRLRTATSKPDSCGTLSSASPSCESIEARAGPDDACEVSQPLPHKKYGKRTWSLACVAAPKSIKLTLALPCGQVDEAPDYWTDDGLHNAQAALRAD